MMQLKIETTVDLRSMTEGETEALLNFIKAFSAQTGIDELRPLEAKRPQIKPDSQPEPTDPSAEPPKKRRRSRAEIEAEKKAKEAAASEAAEQEADPQVEADNGGSEEVTLDEIKLLVQPYVSDAPEKLPIIKKKLLELGAPNVPNLKESKYAEFKTFLENLGE